MSTLFVSECFPLLVKLRFFAKQTARCRSNRAWRYGKRFAFPTSPTLGGYDGQMCNKRLH
jgi:hypothetical protein